MAGAPACVWSAVGAEAAAQGEAWRGERRGMDRAHGWRLHGGTGKGPGRPSWWEGLGQQTWLVATADFLSTLVAAVN